MSTTWPNAQNPPVSNLVKTLCNSAHLKGDLRKIIEHIDVRYSVICEQSNLLSGQPHRGFDFPAHIKSCIAFCSSSMFAKDLMIFINHMAKEWDDQLVNHRDGHDHPSHSFLIVEIDSKSSYSTFFYEPAHPDTRIICIHLYKKVSPYDALFILLHEMGHYIGCRIRDTRILLYKELAVYSFLNEIFYQCCKNKLSHDTNTDQFAMQFNDDPAISSDLAFYPIRLRQLLQSMYNNIRDKIEKNYSLAEIWSKRENEKNDLYGKYLFYMKINMNLAIRETISGIEQMQLSAFQNTFLYGTKKDRYKQLHLGLLQDIITALSTIQANYSKDTYYKFLNTCAFQLSEPTADVFMTKIMCIRFRKYLKHVLIAAWHTWDEKRAFNQTTCNFLQFISDDILRTRILAIAAVNNAKRQDFITFRFLFTLKAKDINAAAHMLGEMFIKEEKQLNMQENNKQSDFALNQNIWNPQIKISNYAITIAKEDFYTNFQKELQNNGLCYKVDAFKASNRVSYALRKLFFVPILRFIKYLFRKSETNTHKKEES